MRRVERLVQGQDLLPGGVDRTQLRVEGEHDRLSSLRDAWGRESPPRETLQPASVPGCGEDRCTRMGAGDAERSGRRRGPHSIELLEVTAQRAQSTPAYAREPADRQESFLRLARSLSSGQLVALSERPTALETFAFAETPEITPDQSRIAPEDVC